MKKTKLTRTLLAACSIVALTAVMYGCTHSSDDPPATDTMEPTAEDQLAALQKEVADLRMQLGLPADGSISTSITELQDEIASLKQQVQDMEDAADTADKKAAAAEALALFTSFSDMAGDTTNADVVTVTVTAVSDMDDGGGSAMVTATVAGTTDGDAAGPNLSGDDVVRTAEAMLGAWQGTMLTDADMAGNSSTAVVYTDVGPNVGKAWAEVYTAGVDAQAIADLQAENANAVIAASKFSTAGLKDHHGDRNMTSGVVTITGTFDGARGAYTCTSAAAGACTSNMTADGIVLGGTATGAAGWMFNPVDSAMVSQPDSMYAYFGWWLNKTASGNPEVDVFHGSNQAVDISAGTFTALGGTATYTGAAAGKYALNRGADQYASGGHWTADATLTANFEDPTQTGAAIVNAAGSISGMIDNFMAGGESMDWSVKLNSASIAVFDTDHDFGLPADGTEWTIGGAAAADAGMWEGDFHNQVAPPDGNNVPGTVTGEFTATYGAVGHMTGAFGAHVE